MCINYTPLLYYTEKYNSWYHWLMPSKAFRNNTFCISKVLINTSFSTMYNNFESKSVS